MVEPEAVEEVMETSDGDNTEVDCLLRCRGGTKESNVVRVR